MTWIGIAQILLYFLILLALTKPLGMYMYRVFEGEKTSLHSILHPLERLIYRLGGVREGEEQS
jgi:K+-transporting ATPase ATPase A chain